MRKFIKIVLLLLAIVILTLAGGIIYLNTPAGQNFVRGQAEVFLQKKLGTDVKIGHLGYGLPKYIELNNVLIRDQAHDTLLSVKTLKVNVAMLQLLHSELAVSEIDLNGVHGHIYREIPDTNFNFTYIITAFAGKSAKQPPPEKAGKTKSAPFKIDVDRVKMDDIHFRFDDSTGGAGLMVNLEHLDLRIKELNFESMLFHIRDLTVAGLQTNFLQDTSYLPIHAVDTSTTQLKLVADNVHLERVQFLYNDRTTNLLFGIQVGGLDLQLNKFDLAQQKIDINKLKIDNTGSVLTFGKRVAPPTAGKVTNATDASAGWNVNAKELALTGVSFKMDDENAQHAKKGIDYAHLELSGVALHTSDLQYTSDTITGIISHLTAKEKSGVEVQELKTKFVYNNKGIALKDIYLQTTHSVIRKNIEICYPSLDYLAQHTESLELNADVENSIVGFEDLLVFAPMLDEQYVFQKHPKAQVRVDAKMNGLLNNLFISRLYLLSLNGTELEVKGRVSNMLQVEKISYNLNIAKLRSSREAVRDFVPDSLLSSVRLPDGFTIAGNIAGTMKDYKTDISLASTDGNAYLKGFVNTSPGTGRENYDMLIQTFQLNIGRVLKQDSTVGKVSAAITAKGTGFDLKTMTTTVNGAIGNAFVEKYNYHDILFNVHLLQGKGGLSLSSADSNLRLVLNGTADFSGKYAAVKADIIVDSIDFRALKLYSSELRASGIIHANFPVLNPDYPEGTFSWVQPIINTNGKRYYMDSISVISKPTEQTGQNITANLDVVTAHISGKTPLTKIGAIITERINRHYSLAKDSAKVEASQTTALKTPGEKPDDTGHLPGDYNLELTARLIDKPLLQGLLPELESFDSIGISGSIAPAKLVFNVFIPEIVYSSITLEKGIINITGKDSILSYHITADKIANSMINLWDADVHGNAGQGKVTANISLSDSNKKEQFALIANMLMAGDSEIFQLQPGLKLNYNSWDVAQPNRIVFAKGGYYVSNFSISQAGQFIKANSAQASTTSPLKLDITNFELSNIFSIVNNGDTSLANGILGAVFTIQNVNAVTKIAGDMELLDLSVLGDTLGNLKATIDLKDENTLGTKLSLTGHGNDLALNGVYYLASKTGNDFDLQLDMKALALKSIEGMAMKQINNSSGFLRGNIHIAGKAMSPVLNGELKTDNLRTNITAINSVFKFPAEKITFSGNTVTFNNFTILDSPDNKAMLNGTVNTTDMLNPAFDLTLKAKKWRAIHSTVKDNSEFYGDLVVTANLNLKGTVSAPIADGDLHVLKGTNLTVVTPESQPELENSVGIVKFINMRDTGRRNVLASHKKAPAMHKKTTGNDVNVNIAIDKEAKFSLVIDQASGDFISMQGDATLNASMNTSGDIGLNGNYELHQGVYQLNYNFIKRKFLIKDGSNITFAGDPVTGATMDVTAVYDAMAPPYDLVERQVTDQTQLNYYKQRLPFEVDLHLQGKIMQPALTFDVVLPENKIYPLTTDQIELIQSKLNQVRMDTSELNKQVFAMLILNRFVSDDPFSSGASTSNEFAALQSASTFIGEQLNNAASHFIKGVDFAVDLATTEDYTTGDMRQRTDLNLAASKQLLNDRLKLTVGNDFELEGQQSTAQQSSYIPTNLAADYQLTEGGRYTTRIYRRAYDEGLLQGYITETGLNFIVSLDYDNFKKDMKKPQKHSSKAKKDSTTTPKN